MDIAKIRKKLKEQGSARVTVKGSLDADKPVETEQTAVSLPPGITSPPAEVETPEPIGGEVPVLESGQGLPHQARISEPVQSERIGEIEAPLSEVAPQLLSPPIETDTSIDLLVFKLAHEEYCFYLGDVKEIIKKQFITPVPLAPSPVIGITSLRGTVIPVIDLSFKVLGIPSKKERKSRILIIDASRGIVGCMVDEVEGVYRCSPQERRDVPEQMTEGKRAFMDAVFIVDGRFITLLKKEAIEIESTAVEK